MVGQDAPDFTLRDQDGKKVTLSELRGIWRTILLVPTLYLAAFVWENRLVYEPSVTRLIILGALLIVMMNARPEGLLGTTRVEVV